jgi:hypothetical protein
VASRVANHDEKAVLLVNGQDYGEIIERTPDKVLHVLRGDGTVKRGLEEEFTGWRLVMATKVVKADGTWMYFAPGTKGPRNITGTQWYTRGGVFV